MNPFAPLARFSQYLMMACVGLVGLAPSCGGRSTLESGELAFATDAGAETDSASDAPTDVPTDAEAGPKVRAGCLGVCEGDGHWRRPGECFNASEASSFEYVRQIAILNGTACPDGGIIVGFQLFRDGHCLRTDRFYCE